MEQKEKQIITSMLTSVIVIVIYTLYVYNNSVINTPEIINDLKFWGRNFMIFIPVAIVAQIIIHIIFAIISTIVTKEGMQTMEDERDKMIELKSIRVAHWIFISGFMMAMGSLALGMEVWVMFTVLILSAFISGMASEVIKLYYYRRGI